MTKFLLPSKRLNVMRPAGAPPIVTQEHNKTKYMYKNIWLEEQNDTKIMSNLLSKKHWPPEGDGAAATGAPRTPQSEIQHPQKQ